MCQKCGCNTCETKITGPLLTESKVKSLLSENLQFHIDENIPLSESKLGLKSKLLLLKEAKKMYSRNILDLSEEDVNIVTLPQVGGDTGIKLPMRKIYRMLKDANYEPRITKGNKVMGISDIEVGIGDDDFSAGMLTITKNGQTFGDELWGKDMKSENELFPLIDEYYKDQLEAEKARDDRGYYDLKEKLKGLDGKACWKGYKLAGTKKKGGKTVDNCVPMEEAMATKDEVLDLIARKNFDKDFKDLSEVEADFVKGEAKKRNLDEEDMDIVELMEMEIIDENITEAKYQGKTVTLNKPTRGDSKKFKVYVNSGKKNADGSIKVKKVNFGHGGTSAKRPTMSIRKSNPKRRKAFRSRFNCDSPGPKTMARYWSCKAW